MHNAWGSSPTWMVGQGYGLVFFFCWVPVVIREVAAGHQLKGSLFAVSFGHTWVGMRKDGKVCVTPGGDEDTSQQQKHPGNWLGGSREGVVGQMQPWKSPEWYFCKVPPGWPLGVPPSLRGLIFRVGAAGLSVQHLGWSFH